MLKGSGFGAALATIGANPPRAGRKKQPTAADLLTILAANLHAEPTTEQVNQVLAGEFPTGDYFRSTFPQSEGDESNLQIDLGSCIDFDERLEVYGQYFELKPIRSHQIRYTQKDKLWAGKFLQKGDEFIATKNRDTQRMALRFYNLALAFSSWKSPTPEAEVGLHSLAIGFAKRAHALFALNYPRAALQDVKAAFKCGAGGDGGGYSGTGGGHAGTGNGGNGTGIGARLEKLKVKCEQAISKYVRGDPKMEFVMEQRRRKGFRDNVLFRLKGPGQGQGVEPATDHFVQVVDDEGGLKKVIVTRPVPAGTVIIVEKPFVVTLDSALRWDLKHCHYCFKTTQNPVPCPLCVFAIFCNDDCFERAMTEYHNYECPCSASLHLVQTPRFMMLAFKAVCIAGPQKLYDLFKAGGLRAIDDAVAKNPGVSGDSDDYSDFLRITADDGNFHPKELAELSVRSLQFVKILSERSTFFKDVDYASAHNMEPAHAQAAQPEELILGLRLGPRPEREGEPEPGSSKNCRKERGPDGLFHFDFPWGADAAGGQAQGSSSKNPPKPAPTADELAERECFERFVTKVVIRHAKGAVAHALYLSETLGLDDVSIRRMGSNSNWDRIRNAKPIHFGLGLYTFTTQVLHSCLPNCARVNDLGARGRHAIYALRPLTPGETVTMDYRGFHFLDEFGPREIIVGEARGRVRPTSGGGCQCGHCKGKVEALAAAVVAAIKVKAFGAKDDPNDPEVTKTEAQWSAVFAGKPYVGHVDDLFKCTECGGRLRRAIPPAPVAAGILDSKGKNKKKKKKRPQAQAQGPQKGAGDAAEGLEKPFPLEEEDFWKTPNLIDGHCDPCKKIYPLNELAGIAASHSVNLDSAQDLIFKNNPLAALDLILPVLTFVSDHIVVAEPREALYGQELLRRAFQEILHFSEED